MLRALVFCGGALREVLRSIFSSDPFVCWGLGAICDQYSIFILKQCGLITEESVLEATDGANVA
jgi:hypothetical protein